MAVEVKDKLVTVESVRIIHDSLNTTINAVGNTANTALSKANEIPTPTTSNNGQFLCVVNGVATWATIANEIPTPTTSNNGQFLCVVNGVATWATISEWSGGSY